jgi:hypothetical protein
LGLPNIHAPQLLGLFTVAPFRSLLCSFLLPFCRFPAIEEEGSKKELKKSQKKATVDSLARRFGKREHEAVMIPPPNIHVPPSTVMAKNDGPPRFSLPPISTDKVPIKVIKVIKCHQVCPYSSQCLELEELWTLQNHL